jgi:hypothetical protein
MDDGEGEPVTLTEGMTISIRTRQDVVDPQQFLAAARRAYRELDPDITEEAAAEAVVSVYDAVHALLDRYGSWRRIIPTSQPALPRSAICTAVSG